MRSALFMAAAVTERDSNAENSSYKNNNRDRNQNRMIQLIDICKTYGKKQNQINALQEISMEIGQGEFLAVMGPSGSGKTTLLNLLGGLERPSGGTYLYQDREVHRMNVMQLNAFRRDQIGFVFQEYNLLDDSTVFENVELPLRMRNIKKKARRDKIQELLELFGIAQCSRKYPSELSGGEQQRCAIARAVAADCQLLLADEPTGSLDSGNGIQVMEILAGLNRERGTTIVMVTHDRGIAEYAGRIIFIRDGRISENVQ